jgi:hypothetical protein
MPGFDRTGPAGAGPMTGRQLGRCTGNATGIPGRDFRYYGRGLRGGFRRGRGWGYGYRWGNPFADYASDYPQVSDETFLENEARSLKDQLSRIEKELEKIRKENKND